MSKIYFCLCFSGSILSENRANAAFIFAVYLIVYFYLQLVQEKTAIKKMEKLQKKLQINAHDH